MGLPINFTWYVKIQEHPSYGGSLGYFHPYFSDSLRGKSMLFFHQTEFAKLHFVYTFVPYIPSRLCTFRALVSDLHTSLALFAGLFYASSNVIKSRV